jgi:hypothetical protein
MVPIIISQEVKENIKFDFEKNIKDLLQIIPSDHLIHLGKIEVMYSTTDRVFGYYYGKSQVLKQAYIVIYAKHIMDYCPTFFSYICPFIVRFVLSGTLYHEIGHHYQRIQPGFKKKIWERHADKYSLRMQRKMFLSKGMGRVVYSLRFLILPLINFLRKRI